MQLRSFETARDFLKDIERDFARNEVEHHLLLGVAHDLAGKRSTAPAAALVTLRDDDGLAMAALMTSPKPMVLAANPTSNAIYTRIGYRPVSDSVMMTFRSRAIGFRSTVV